MHALCYEVRLYLPSYHDIIISKILIYVDIFKIFYANTRFVLFHTSYCNYTIIINAVNLIIYLKPNLKGLKSNQRRGKRRTSKLDI